MEKDVTLSENEKKAAVLRSASYPYLTIEEALDFVSQIKKSFPASNFTREDIVAVLKRTTINRDTAAAVQYGLLEKKIGEGYKISKRAKDILNPVTENEKSENLIDCFYTPKLYSDLINRFKGHALPPEQQLKAILNRYYNITELAAPQATEIFINNAKDLGLLDENRILLGSKNDHEILNDQLEEGSSGSAIEQINNTDIKELNNTPLPKKPLLLEEINSSTDIKILLTGKKVAHLIYPENINEKDIQILKLQLEALALTL